MIQGYPHLGQHPNGQNLALANIETQIETLVLDFSQPHMQLGSQKWVHHWFSLVSIMTLCPVNSGSYLEYNPTRFHNSSTIIWRPKISGSEDTASTFLHQPLAFASRLCGTCFGSWYRRIYFRPAQCINRQRTNRLGNSNRLSQKRNFRTLGGFLRDLMWFC